MSAFASAHTCAISGVVCCAPVLSHIHVDAAIYGVFMHTKAPAVLCVGGGGEVRYYCISYAWRLCILSTESNNVFLSTV